MATLTVEELTERLRRLETWHPVPEPRFWYLGGVARPDEYQCPDGWHLSAMSHNFCQNDRHQLC